MQSFAESGRFIECSGRIVLWCEECGEALVLLGREEDWGSERTFFEYHLYDLPRPTTIKNNQTKQIGFLSAQGARGLINDLDADVGAGEVSDVRPGAQRRRRCGRASRSR